EAGLLATRQMVALLEYASKHQSRLILSGDTRQHMGIEAGDALRILEQHSALRVVQLDRIQRQLSHEYRLAIEEIAHGKAEAALLRLERAGAVQAIPDDERY